jgi:Uma2 family endonuclease
MSASPQVAVKITPQEYLAFERQATEKHEFVDGIIYAMSGANENHALITGNVAGELHLAFKKRIEQVYISNMRVKVNESDYVYPDVIAVCGDAQFEDNTFDTLSNPTVIIEILSDSTERYDKKLKAKLYHALNTVQDLVLISQTHCYMEHYHRQTATQWLFTIISQMDEKLTLPSVNVTIAVQDIYDKVSFKLE